MPLLILACEMCPKNIEGTMYALLMSMINFGGMVSDQLGGLLTVMLNLDANNFDNLPALIIVTSVSWLLPLGLVLLTDFEKPKCLVEITNNNISTIEISKEVDEKNKSISEEPSPFNEEDTFTRNI